MRNYLGSRQARLMARVILLVLMLYVFLAAIELFGGAAKMVGKEAAENLLSGLKNPFAGLAVGILATAMVQSSSFTTSLVVILVGSGQLPLLYAVPVVMGANIGTSVTNTIVSLGHVTRNVEFRRAFAGATVHDIFNLMTVAVLFPLELATGYLRHTAEWLVSVMNLQGGGGGLANPVKLAVKWLAGLIQSVMQNGLGLQKGPLLAALIFALAMGMIFFALAGITKNMRALMADRIEQWLNRVLGRSGFLGVAIGAGMTALLQSSSITTSLLIPMFGAGVLTLEAGFPLMLGANIGTTITALLASSVAGPLGVTIALVHLLFNLSGTLIFFPLTFMRRIPIRLAEKLADLAVTNRFWVLAYIVGVFFLVPLLGIWIWK